MKYNFTLIIALLFFAFSCGKNDWKKTAPAKVEMAMSSTAIFEDDSALYIDTLEIKLNTAQVSGERLQADNVHLSSVLSDQIFTNTTSVEVAQFDVPQGTYESLRFAFGLKTNVDNLIIKGRYINPQGSEKAVLVRLQLNDVIEKAVIEFGSETVLVEEGVSKNLNLIMDMEQLFSQINTGIWNAAIPSNVGGVSTIEISSINNQNMYIDINNQVNNAFSIVSL